MDSDTGSECCSGRSNVGSTDSVQIVSATSSKKQKCSAPTVSTNEVLKKQSVSYSTYLKWRMKFDKDCQTISWLDCDVSGTAGKKTVEKLKCKICLKYKARIECKRNYSEKWLIGADSV